MKTHAGALSTGQGSNEVIKYGEEKRRDRRKEHQIDYFPLVPSSESLLTHFVRTGVLDLNSSLSPLPNSSGIQHEIKYHTHSAYHLGVGPCQNRHGGRASPDYLASMEALSAGIVGSHQWSSVVYVNHVASSHSLTCSKLASQKMVILIKFRLACTLLSLHAVLPHALNNISSSQ